MFEVINWPEASAPSRSPIHFTNELEVEASPETIWSLLVGPHTWPSFYPGVEHVHLLEGHDSLRLGTRFETNLAGQDIFASVQEFQPVTRIAWGGHPKASEASKAYHAWIVTPTSKGTHHWTEETMRGRSGLNWRSRTLKSFGAHTRTFSPRSPRSRPSEKAASVNPPGEEM
ncbi:SRPBCC family protein [Streptomyces sp. NPDC005349]|uniref:SRPBCC family protein n=1 Tax=Streptomyces sp. NPDC005349 TaxID=3157037 RepID=UPI0033B00B1E